MTSSYHQHLTSFTKWAADLRFEDLSSFTVERTQQTLFDAVGVMLAGSLEPEMRDLSKRLPRLPGHRATVLTHAFEASEPLWAAFYNATEAVFLELDEHHRPTGHPGSHVIPSALATAETLGSSGRELITAIVVGYDMAARLSNGCVLRDFMHCHGHMGGVGAAVANGKLRHFDQDTMEAAIHIAAGMPLFSSWQPCFEGATVRNTYTGMSAITGILAADLAASGFTGLDQGLEHTFGELIGSSFDLNALDLELGKPQIDTNMFKFHACCGMNHPPLDALAAAIREYQPEWQEIDHVIVHTIERCMRLNTLPAPKQLATKFSIPFAIATALYNKHTRPSAFTDEMAANQDILELASRVCLTPDNKLSAAWPQAGGAAVEVILRGGRRLYGEVKDPYGWHTRPSNLTDIINKFHYLNHSRFNERQAEAAWNLFSSISQMESIAGLFLELSNL